MSVVSVHPSLTTVLNDHLGTSSSTVSEAEWERILKQASAHGLTFMMQEWPGLPASVRETVDQECLRIIARNLALAGELRMILRAFRDRGIDCVPVRGVALAERLYGRIPPRPMGDIDLLVRRGDLTRVQALFRELGFIEMDRRPGFASEFSYTLKFFVERPMMVIVEPHWTIAYPPFADRLDMEAVWSRCVPTHVVGEETLSLGREDLLIHLCLHLNHRDDAPFLWLYELDRYVRQESDTIRWDLVLSISREASVERLVGSALKEAVIKLGSPVPADVLVGLGRPGRSRPFSQRVLESSDMDGVESLANFFAVQGLGVKLRYCRALFFPTPEFMILQYGLTHRHQLPATYVRRFCWLSWQAAKGLLHICIRRAH